MMVLLDVISLPCSYESIAGHSLRSDNGSQQQQSRGKGFNKQETKEEQKGEAKANL